MDRRGRNFYRKLSEKNDQTVNKIWLPLQPFSTNDLKNPAYQMLQGIMRDEKGRDLEDLDFFGWQELQTLLAERKKLAKVYRFCPAFGLKCYQKFSPIQYTIDGGSEAIIHALAKNIAPNNIKMQHTLKSLKKLENGLYQLTFTMPDGKDKIVEAEKVIMGIPFSAWKKIPGLMNEEAQAIFGADLINLIKDLPYCNIRKVMLVPSAEVITKKHLSFGLDLDRGIEGWQQQFGSYTLMFGGSTYKSVPFQDQAAIDNVMSKLSGNEVKTGSMVEKLQPNAYSFVDVKTWLNHFRQLQYPQDNASSPVKTFAHNIVQGSKGTVFIVGEHVAQTTGYMNSAVTSAHWAANTMTLSDFS